MLHDENEQQHIDMCNLISDAIDKLKEFETIMPFNDLGDMLSKVKHKLELLLDEA